MFKKKKKIFVILNNIADHTKNLQNRAFSTNLKLDFKLDETMYLKRTIEDFLNKAMLEFPAILITGPRQVGKTTVLQKIRPNYSYVSLDDPILANLAKEEPKLFLDRFKTPIIIDEIQYAPQLLPYIKIEIDKNRKPGAFLLTGSQQFHLMHGISESLAGRVGIINLLGLSLREITQNNDNKAFIPSDLTLKNSKNLLEIYEIIWRGFFPTIITNKESDKDFFYSSYIQTYIQRDVRSLTQVANERDFLKFITAIAARTSQILNMSEIAKDVGISVPTVKNWLSILQTSSLIYLLEPYHNNITTRLIKSPKIYFLDTGLASYLTRWSSPNSLEAGAMSGAIFETFVFSEILKSYWHTGKSAPLYYYRDKDQKEIDLLIFNNDICHPVEIKKTASFNKNMVANFNVLYKLGIKQGEGSLICFADNILPITNNINAVPVWSI